MPSKSQQQRKLIFAKRGRYGSESDTPKKWRFIWEEGWENKGKLPYKVKKKKNKKKYENQVITFSNFLNENIQEDYSPITLELIKSNIIECLHNINEFEDIENNIEANKLIEKTSKDIMISIKNSLKPDVISDYENYSDISNIYFDLEEKIWNVNPANLQDDDSEENDKWIGFQGNEELD